MPKQTQPRQGLHKTTIDQGDSISCLNLLREVLEAALPAMHARDPRTRGDNVVVVLMKSHLGSPCIHIATRQGTTRRRGAEMGCIEYRPELSVDDAFTELCLQFAGNLIGLWCESIEQNRQCSKSCSGQLTTMN